MEQIKQTVKESLPSKKQPSVTTIHRILTKADFLTKQLKPIPAGRNSEANIEARNKYGSTALNVATVNGYTGIVQLLLEKGANIEAKDNEGNTPLMAAARHERSMIVELLLVRGANSNARNLRGANALELLQSRQAARAVTLDDFTVHTTPTALLLKESMHREPRHLR